MDRQSTLRLDKDANLPVLGRSQPVTTQPSPSVWLRLHRRLRGRYFLCLLLLLALACTGAAVGYQWGKLYYRSRVVLEIEPIIPQFDHSGQSAPVLAGFNALIDRQVELIHSQPLINDAIARAGWHSTDPAVDDKHLEEAFRHRLSVSRDALATRLLRLHFTDPDPRTADAALRAVVETYADAFHASMEKLDLAGTRQLVSRRNQLREELEILKDTLSRLETASPAMPLDQMYEIKVAELSKITQQLSQARIALTALDDQHHAMQAQGTPSAELVAQLAREDDTLRNLLLRKHQAEERLHTLQQRMGANAPAIVRLKNEIGTLDAQIVDRAQKIPAISVPLVDMDVEGSLTLTYSELLSRRDRIETLHATVTDEVEQLRSQLEKVDTLQTQIANSMQLIDQADEELSRQAMEGRIGGRLTIPGRDIQSATLYSDTRPTYAAIGSGAGLLLATLLVTLLIGGDQRILTSEKIRESQPDAPLLGAVPLINPRNADPADADRSALAIHEMRALLEVRARTDGSKVFAITSSSTGSGKTSLTVGLASSLALSGTRTLLIDCDLSQRVRSDQAGPGDKNKDHAQTPTRNLDEVMIQMGYLDERETEIFMFPEDADMGLVGMLQGQPLSHCMIESTLPNLHILPALKADAQHVGQISAKFIRRLIHEAYDRYDMILFDTGTIPGSVESLCVAGEVDGVIVVASRGEMQSRFNRTMSHLKLVHAKIAGVVFNRAAASDTSIDMPRSRNIRKIEKNAGARRLPIGQNMGSGILAAAVHAQSQSTPGTPAAISSNGHNRPPSADGGNANPEAANGYDTSTQGDSAQKAGRDAFWTLTDAFESAGINDAKTVAAANNVPLDNDSRIDPDIQLNERHLEQAMDHLMDRAIDAGKQPRAKPAAPVDAAKNAGK